MSDTSRAIQAISSIELPRRPDELLLGFAAFLALGGVLVLPLMLGCEALAGAIGVEDTTAAGAVGGALLTGAISFVLGNLNAHNDARRRLEQQKVFQMRMVESQDSPW